MSIDVLVAPWGRVGEAHVVACGRRARVYFTTYLGDALSELVEVGIALALGVRQSFATLLGEPVGHRIFFSGDEILLVEIVRFEDPLSPEERWNRGKVRWAGRISRASLIESIRDMVETVRDEHDSGEYERVWGFPFPVERYEMLRNL